MNFSDGKLLKCPIFMKCSNFPKLLPGAEPFLGGGDNSISVFADVYMKNFVVLSINIRTCVRNRFRNLVQKILYD